jgi:acetyl esterase/lipase
MTIFDRSKIARTEILRALDDLQVLRDRAASEFFADPDNQKIDFEKLWAKVTDGNQRWHKGEQVVGLLSRDEQLFLARQHRHVVEFRANAFQARDRSLVEVESVDAGGVAAEWQTAPGVDHDTVVIYLHGGGYIMGSPNFMRRLSVRLGRAVNARVLSLDYRLSPEHSYPAGVEDCVSAFRWLLDTGYEPQRLLIAGDSAGGYYTLTTLLRMRDAGLPLPAAAVCLAPGTDLALTGDSLRSNGPTDPVLADLGLYWWVEAHLNGADPYSPEVSPLYADLAGLPPLLVQVSTSEMLYDDARMLVERASEAGVDVTLQTWDDTLHVFQQLDLPESGEAIAAIASFARAHLQQSLEGQCTQAC